MGYKSSSWIGEDHSILPTHRLPHPSLSRDRMQTRGTERAYVRVWKLETWGIRKLQRSATIRKKTFQLTEEGQKMQHSLQDPEVFFQENYLEEFCSLAWFQKSEFSCVSVEKGFIPWNPVYRCTKMRQESVFWTHLLYLLLISFLCSPDEHHGFSSVSS